jgi:hypothetical protein
MLAKPLNASAVWAVMLALPSAALAASILALPQYGVRAVIQSWSGPPPKFTAAVARPLNEPIRPSPVIPEIIPEVSAATPPAPAVAEAAPAPPAAVEAPPQEPALVEAPIPQARPVLRPIAPPVRRIAQAPAVPRAAAAAPARPGPVAQAAAPAADPGFVLPVEHPSKISGLVVGPQGDGWRLTLEADGPTSAFYSVLPLGQQVLIALPQATWNIPVHHDLYAGRLILADWKNGVLTVTAAAPVDITGVTTATPVDAGPYRLMFDLKPENGMPYRRGGIVAWGTKP